MKRVLLIVSLLLPLLSGTATGGSISKSKITTFITDCQRYEGVEVVQLGGLATLGLRSALKLSTIGDPEAREVLQLISKIKRISVLEYEDCEPAIQDKITRKLDRLLKDGDLLMETRDGDDLMQIFGVVDDEKGTVNDFVLHTPTSHSLICIFGSIPIEKLAKIVAEND